MTSQFLNKDAPDDQLDAVSRVGLRETVSQYVESGEKMESVFPGFRFKSTSTKKVLGKLPDLVEEILLS
jgi:pyoverdine/dityrosine biosynthesis protein Dit1